MASSGSSEGSKPKSKPCPIGAIGAPSSPAKMGEERRTSESRGPGWAVTNRLEVGWGGGGGVGGMEEIQGFLVHPHLSLSFPLMVSMKVPRN